MIGLEDFRDRMKAEIEKTKQMKSVQVSGRNLDDALRQASLELGLPLRVLEYEVLDRGRSGLLGIKNAPCRIIAYESVAQQIEKEETINTFWGFNLSGRIILNAIRFQRT